VHRLLSGQTPLNRAGIIIARMARLRGRPPAARAACPNVVDIVAWGPPDRDPKRAARTHQRAIPGFRRAERA